jgi:hypothetical protein
MTSYQQQFDISIAIFAAFQPDHNEEGLAPLEFSKNLHQFKTCCNTNQGYEKSNQSGMAEQVQKYEDHAG